MERITNEDSIVFRIGKYEIAKFEDCGNGMEGNIFEGNSPIHDGAEPLALEASDMCALAAWLLIKAEQRARDAEFYRDDALTASDDRPKDG